MAVTWSFVVSYVARFGHGVRHGGHSVAKRAALVHDVLKARRIYVLPIGHIRQFRVPGGSVGVGAARVSDVGGFRRTWQVSHRGSRGGGRAEASGQVAQAAVCGGADGAGLFAEDAAGGGGVESDDDA